MLKITKLFLAVFLGLFLVKTALSFDRIVNYSPTNAVNGFAADGNKIWVATTGGLYCYDRANGTGSLYSDPVLFPDPEITALCIDAHHTLWAGTSKGYLYKRTSQGAQTVINSYFMSGWRITALDTAGKYLIVGTTTGCSLFDTDKLIALKNASGFADGYPTQVNAIATVIDTLHITDAFHFRDTFHLRDTLHLLDTLHLPDTFVVRDTFIVRDTTLLVRDTTRVLRDTTIHQEMLLIGTDRGIVRLYDTGRALLGTLASANFFDRSIWKIDSVQKTVKSIVVTPDGYFAAAGPAAWFKNRLAIGDSTALKSDSVAIAVLPSVLTTLYSNNNQDCLIGTGNTYFYIWDGQSAPRQVKIAGPSFSTVTNIIADREGNVWVSPQVSAASHFPAYPWEGYSVFKNGYWQLYSPVDFPAIGWMGEGPNDASAEDGTGRMWFGGKGGSVKRYDRGNNTWRTYCIYASTEGAGFDPSPNGGCGGSNWAYCEGITSDSTGFLWMAGWKNVAGCLICYDPKFEPNSGAQSYENAHFRRFWNENEKLYYDDVNKQSISLITTDIANHIIVGYTNGQIVVFSHDGNPLRDSIRIDTVFTQNTTEALAAVSTPDSLTRIAFGSGFYTFDARNKKLLSGLCAISSPSGDSVVDSTLRGITSLAAEDERVLWLGTRDSGLIRYDLLSNAKTVIDETKGLLSNHITGLSIDRKGGYLWIASDRGVSRYTIGYQIGSKNTGPPVVYPNPFSKKRHREMVFEKLPPGSSVALYTVSGSLIASLSPQETSVYGSACVWTPSPAIAPGIYLFTIRSKTNSRQGRVLITP